MRAGAIVLASALTAGSVKKFFSDFRTQLSPRRIEIESELLGESGQNHLLQIAIRLSPREDDTLEDADARIAENELLAHFATRAESTTRRTGAERRVEREVARLELRKRDAAFGAAVSFREEVIGAFVRALDLDQAFGELECRLHRIVETAAIFGANYEAVDDDGDVVIHPPIKLRGLGDLDELTVDDGANEALLTRRIEQLAKLAFATAHERSENLDPRPFGPLEDGVGDLSRALTLYRAAAVGAVRSAGSRVQKPEVIVDLCHRPDRGARIMAGGFLLDGDRGRQSLDGVNVGLLHQTEELTGVTRQGFHVPALALGIYGVEGERRLPRT